MKSVNCVRDNWKECTIGCPVDGKVKVAHCWIKCFDEGSVYGIDEGRISKLMIKIDGQTVVNYDRGWDIEPDENDLATMIAYSICLNDYN